MINAIEQNGRESSPAQAMREYDAEQKVLVALKEHVLGNHGFLDVPNLGPAIERKVAYRFEQKYPVTLVQRPGEIWDEADKTSIDSYYQFKDKAVILKKSASDDPRIYMMVIEMAKSYNSKARDEIKAIFDDSENMYMCAHETIMV